jgi:hypothetical protein
MSKFVDKLKSISKSSGTPIGFHAAVSELKMPVMMLVVGLSGTQAKEAKILADADADGGLILSEGPSIKSVKQMVEAAGNVPVGVFVKDMTEEKIDELAGSGCDFMVFDIKSPATVLHKEGVGKLMMIEPTVDQGLVRAISSFEVDGVIVTNRGGDSFVALEHLLVCRRFVELLEKPVIIALPSLVSKGELTSLWQAGVDGIVTPAMQSSEALAGLKKVIGDLPRGARGRRPKVGVMLPRYGERVAGEEDEEQDGI